MSVYDEFPNIRDEFIQLRKEHSDFMDFLDSIDTSDDTEYQVSLEKAEELFDELQIVRLKNNMVESQIKAILKRITVDVENPVEQEELSDVYKDLLEKSLILSLRMDNVGLNNSNIDRMREEAKPDPEPDPEPGNVDTSEPEANT